MPCRVPTTASGEGCAVRGLVSGAPCVGRLVPTEVPCSQGVGLEGLASVPAGSGLQRLRVSRGGQGPPAPWLYLGQGEGHCPCVPQSSPSPPAPCCTGSTAHPQRGKSKGSQVGAMFFIATPSLLMPCNQSVHRWLIMAVIAFLLPRPPTGRCIGTDLPLPKPTRMLQDSERVTSAGVSFPRCPALHWHPTRHQEGRWAPHLLSDLCVGAKDWFGLFVSDGARWYILYFNFN